MTTTGISGHWHQPIGGNITIVVIWDLNESGRKGQIGKERGRGHMVCSKGFYYCASRIIIGEYQVPTELYL